MVSTFGLHGSVLMQLARRGCQRSGRKIRPGEAEGRLQAIRDSMAQGEMSKKPVASPKKHPPVTPHQKEVGFTAVGPTVSTSQTQHLPSRVAHIPKECAAPQPKGVIDGKKETGKNLPNLTWKPKARAAGQPGSEQATGGELITTDAAVHRFGSEKYLHPDDAALLAAQRASNLQMALGMDTFEEKTEGSNAGLPLKVTSSKDKKTTATIIPSGSCGGEKVMISTYNPCTGKIPQPEQVNANQPPCLRGKEVSPLDPPAVGF